MNLNDNNTEIERLLRSLEAPEGYTNYICREHGPFMVRDTEEGVMCPQCTRGGIPASSDEGIVLLTKWDRRKARAEKVRKIRKHLED